MKKKFLRGFTLIELLVVITIIGILAGLAIPAISGVMKAAKKVEAKTLMSSMQTAVVNYQTEYNTYPAFMTGTNATLSTKTDWQNFYTVMVAPPSQTNSPLFSSNNSRLISFLTIGTKYLYAASGSSTVPTTDPTAAGVYPKDPWAKLYVMWVDTDYNNVVGGVPNLATGSGTKDMPGTVMVWSSASDKPTGEIPDTNTASIVKNSIGTWK